MWTLVIWVFLKNEDFIRLVVHHYCHFCDVDGAQVKISEDSGIIVWILIKLIEFGVDSNAVRAVDRDVDGLAHVLDRVGIVGSNKLG